MRRRCSSMRAPPNRRRGTSSLRARPSSSAGLVPMASMPATTAPGQLADERSGEHRMPARRAAGPGQQRGELRVGHRPPAPTARSRERPPPRDAAPQRRGRRGRRQSGGPPRAGCRPWRSRSPAEGDPPGVGEQRGLPRPPPAVPLASRPAATRACALVWLQNHKPSTRRSGAPVGTMSQRPSRTAVSRARSRRVRVTVDTARPARRAGCAAGAPVEQITGTAPAPGPTGVGHQPVVRGGPAQLRVMEPDQVEVDEVVHGRAPAVVVGGRGRDADRVLPAGAALQAGTQSAAHARPPGCGGRPGSARSTHPAGIACLDRSGSWVGTGGMSVSVRSSTTSSGRPLSPPCRRAVSENECRTASRIRAGHGPAGSLPGRPVRPYGRTS